MRAKIKEIYWSPLNDILQVMLVCWKQNRTGAAIRSSGFGFDSKSIRFVLTCLFGRSPHDILGTIVVVQSPLMNKLQFSVPSKRLIRKLSPREGVSQADGRIHAVNCRRDHRGYQFCQETREYVA